jgi:hypothetical protein
MAMVVNQVKMDDDDQLDVGFWLSKTTAERIGEVTRLRRLYYTFVNGVFPEKIEKVVTRLQLNYLG